jgi:hypothetical protein
MSEFLPGKFFDVEPTTVDTLREKLRNNMEMLKDQDVYEHTLYKKWVEVQRFKKLINRSQVVKAKIWTPTDIFSLDRTIEEIEAMQLRIRYISPDTEQKLLDEWLMLRTFVSTMKFDQNPGRILKFLIYDDTSGGYLGLASISSDVISITARDNHIGWTKEDRLDGDRLKHSAIGTCIVATQPFGYNFLGGKLIASLLTTQAVRDAWEEVTAHQLVGLTTTALYGAQSMYNGIPYWKTLGETKGKIYIKPDDDVYEEWHHWLKKNHYDEYIRVTVKEGIVGPVTGIKQKILDLIFKYASLKASRYTHGFSRGVYYADLYENTKEFFRREIEADQLILKPRVAKDIGGVTEWWKKKAVKRYTKLHTENRLKPEILYHNIMIGMSWEEAKKLYLEDVGR